MSALIDLTGSATGSRALPQRTGRAFDLPTLAQLLTQGGDTRIVCDPVHGHNKYGCSPVPDSSILAYGSSTASTITPRSFAAAARLRERLLRAARFETPSVTYARELARIRTELLNLCELSDLSSVDVIFAASGTDLHLIAAQLAGEMKASPLLAVMIAATETGSGVPAALGGRHFSDCTALGSLVTPGMAIFGGAEVEVAAIASRAADGSPRAAADMDAEVEALVVKAAEAGRRVLLNLVDVSKTGMIAPTLGCALELRRRFPASVEVLVDGCQFRLSPATLRAYLRHGFWIALTGSKFVGGPAFSGALLLPAEAVRRLHARPLPPEIRAYSARADWPADWPARFALPDVENYGLLLRWEAALAELRAFRALPEAAVAAFVETFAEKVRERLMADPAFQPLPVLKLDRRPLVSAESCDRKSWDQTPTIFPFILRRPPGAERLGAPLSRKETARVYEWMTRDDAVLPGLGADVLRRRCQLGQPVQCGVLDGVPVSALRVCASVRLIVDALSPQGRGAEAVITDALFALDKAALLVASEAMTAHPSEKRTISTVSGARA